MNRRYRAGTLVLAVIASVWGLQTQAQQPAKEEASKAAAQREHEARRGLAGFEWIEPRYPDCPRARFKLHNDECGGVKRHPRDPEDVLGDYWRRSVWAYSPQFAERFKPADKSAVRADLPRHVQAIELRVVWNDEHYRYQCEVNLFIENALMIFVKLPAGRRGARFSGAGMLPSGAERPLPHMPAWGGFDDEAFAEYDETSFSLVGYNTKKEPGAFVSGRLLRYHRDIVIGIGYLGFRDMCRNNLLSYSPHEIWLPAARTANAPAAIRRYGNSDYLALPLPSGLIERAAPYWRRASDLLGCAAAASRTTFSPGGLEREFRACEALRRAPIDSDRTRIDLLKEQWQLDQRRKAR